ncbi:MAG: hypothetical protein E7324_07955 [Clostridiales bacterium]|nr:hypothetical protein [Clostridiales bacterium]
MIEQDTIRLLRECDAGVQMGMDAINQVIRHVQAPALEKRLAGCLREHERLNDEIKGKLHQYQDTGKNPPMMAKGMSWMKTNVELALHDSDHTIADLMTDGCNMGVKSLNKYLNEYEAADEESKDMAKRLIQLEEKLAVDIRDFL